MSDSLRPHGLYSPWNSPGQNTGVGSLSLLQGIFPTQGSNPGLPHCGRILYQLSHKGSPRMLEWVAYPFSSRSSQPRNQTGISCIASGFFTSWAIREDLIFKEALRWGHWLRIIQVSWSFSFHRVIIKIPDLTVSKCSQMMPQSWHPWETAHHSLWVLTRNSLIPERTLSVNSLLC